MTFKLENLPYPYDALEPYIDATTMELHHSKHHLSYCNQLNEAIHGTKFEKMKSVEEILLRGADELPAAIRNHGGGFANHNLFWQIMNPKNGTGPTGDLSHAIKASFGSFHQLKDKFTSLAKAHFGSGWTWLVVNQGRVEITTTPNQDSPLMDQKVPILGLDLWEHAYYLKFQNKRPEYITAWWNVVNWNRVEELYNEAVR